MINKNEVQGTTPEISTEKKKKKTLIVTIIVLAVVLVAVVVVGVLFLGNIGTGGKMKTAKNYLEDLEYEKAIAVYEEIIDIDSMNEEAYAGLAFAYFQIGDYENAEKYYEIGYEETNSETLYNGMVMCQSVLEQKEETAKLEKELKEIKDAEEKKRAEEEAYANSFEGIREKMKLEYGVGYSVGMMMPDFTTTSLDGKTVSLNDFLGKPLYINCFTTWCPYCDMEVPDMNNTYAKHNSEVNFMMLDLAETVDDAKWYANEFNISIPMYIQNDWSIGSFSVNGVPTTFVLDSYGRIVAMTEGMADASWIEGKTLDAINQSKNY